VSLQTILEDAEDRHLTRQGLRYARAGTWAVGGEHRNIDELPVIHRFDRALTHIARKMGYTGKFMVVNAEAYIGKYSTLHPPKLALPPMWGYYDPERNLVVVLGWPGGKKITTEFFDVKTVAAAIHEMVHGKYWGRGIRVPIVGTRGQHGLVMTREIRKWLDHFGVNKKAWPKYWHVLRSNPGTKPQVARYG
jgi:hypothetical protein